MELTIVRVCHIAPKYNPFGSNELNLQEILIPLFLLLPQLVAVVLNKIVYTAPSVETVHFMLFALLHSCSLGL